MKKLNDSVVVGSGAKSMVMTPLFRTRTEVDRKKRSKTIRGEKHRGKHEF